jgi:hypothetical protein
MDRPLDITNSPHNILGVTRLVTCTSFTKIVSLQVAMKTIFVDTRKTKKENLIDTPE